MNPLINDADGYPGDEFIIKRRLGTAATMRSMPMTTESTMQSHMGSYPGKSIEGKRNSLPSSNNEEAHDSTHVVKLRQVLEQFQRLLSFAAAHRPGEVHIGPELILYFVF